LCWSKSFDFEFNLDSILNCVFSSKFKILFSSNFFLKFSCFFELFLVSNSIFISTVVRVPEVITLDSDGEEIGEVRPPPSGGSSSPESESSYAADSSDAEIFSWEEGSSSDRDCSCVSEDAETFSSEEGKSSIQRSSSSISGESSLAFEEPVVAVAR
jgi:hypothetical protein